MNATQRLELLDQALKTDDKAVLAALTNPATSPLLTGLSGEQMSRYRSHYLDRFLPADNAKIDATQAVSDTISSAMRHI